MFQASFFDGKTRVKGFLLISCQNDESAFTFTQEKPTPLMPSGGVAMLIRKHLAAGAVSGLAITTNDSDEDIYRLTILGRDSDNHSTKILLTLNPKAPREISIIRDGSSLARLRQNGQFTVSKPVPESIQVAQDIPDEGFQLWLQSLRQVDHQKLADSSSEAKPGRLPEYQRAARDRLARRLKTLRKTLAEDERKVSAQKDIDALMTEAELLKNHLWRIQPESFELRLDTAMTGSDAIVIELDPTRSPGANLEERYIKIKKMERSVAMGKPRVNLLQQQISDLENTLGMLRLNVLSQSEVQNLLHKFQIEHKTTPSKTSPQKIRDGHSAKTLGRIFRSSTGESIFVGRSALESDALVKASRSQDWWFHIAGGAHGGHVIVSGQKHREHLPANLLREAAILALHFSDRSHSREGDVYVSRRHNIKKRKGMPPGLWQIDRAETIMIRYTPEELASIFAVDLGTKT